MEQESVNLGHHSTGPERLEFDSTGTQLKIENLIALSDIVIVDPEKEEVTKGGIVLPSTGNAQNVRVGKVVAVGPGRFHDGVFIKTSVKVGDTVLFGKFASAGEPIKIDGKDYKLFRENDLFARLSRDV